MVNVLKFRTLFSFCSEIKHWLSGLELTKCSSGKQTQKTLIRQLLHRQPDLGLHCLSRHFGRQLVFETLEHLQWRYPKFFQRRNSNFTPVFIIITGVHYRS